MSLDPPEAAAPLAAALAELEAARQHFYPSLAKAGLNAIRQSTAESCFLVELNGECFYLPRDVFRTIYHCVHGTLDGPLKVIVESGHLDWMRAHMRDGAVFVDVGAATGQIALPMSRVHEGRVHVIAFEPARNTRKILRRTLEVNGIANVEVVEHAAAARSGEVLFTEYGFDETGETPWLPEGSSIDHPLMDHSRASSYPITAVTLDEFFADRPDRSQVALIKIDVEGFEIDVIDGALTLIDEVKPKFSIDIHNHPFIAGGTTEPAIIERLRARGYRFEKLAHVLVCEPCDH